MEMACCRSTSFFSLTAYGKTSGRPAKRLFTYVHKISRIFGLLVSIVLISRRNIDGRTFAIFKSYNFVSEHDPLGTNWSPCWGRTLERSSTLVLNKNHDSRSVHFRVIRRWRRFLRELLSLAFSTSGRWSNFFLHEAQAYAYRKFIP